MSPLLIIALIVVHWIGDFVLQTHDMASKKSSSNYWLGLHVGTYTATLAVMFGLGFGLPGIVYAGVNGLLHVVVDFFTSRASAKQFGKDWHHFFVIIGFDQMVHMICLVGTAWLIL